MQTQILDPAAAAQGMREMAVTVSADKTAPRAVRVALAVVDKVEVQAIQAVVWAELAQLSVAVAVATRTGQ